MDKDQMLFASVVGSKVAEMLPRFEMVQNELAKHVLPPIPFLPNKVKGNEEGFHRDTFYFDKESLWQADSMAKHESLKESRKGFIIEKQFFPLTFSRPIPGEQEYTFPYEPLITIAGKNNIVTRNVAKAAAQSPAFFGTIKEHWSQGDYTITITGTLIGQKEIGPMEDCFPKSDFLKLKEYCTSSLGIKVNCEPLQLLGIDHLVVTDFTFPFTKGENVQAYEITCLSDFSADFLLEIQD